ncbi:hypothetical protein AMS58_05670 [Pseudoalteromonas porphyrae]|uniref:DUF4426 domain-containing protein n=2 Tax=Pseudoalteromonas TaxID=53246 RepID=A0A0N1MVH9_9GAMM|nr:MULTISPECIES: hypothetical protein [Pseudoalteromonas]KPH65487.1 hypothetical protein ADS77_00715 [Pseudoalteromonas porphyrae]KPH95679.1 hypothetical protein AMS58_05670 [Pseudoalteromonas porphyrae]
MKNMHLLFLCSLLLPISAAANDVLSVDQVGLQGMQFAFENDARIKPKNSDFSVVNSVFMSSEAGKRLAVITVRNDASGSRILEGSHLMALFADGSRKGPSSLTDGIKLDDGELRSVTVSFGEADYPILAIYTSKNFN